MSIKSVSKIMAAIASADTSFTWESEDAYKIAKKFIDLVEDCSPNVVLDVLENNVPNDDYETFDDPEKDVYYGDEDDFMALAERIREKYGLKSEDRSKLQRAYN